MLFEVRFQTSSAFDFKRLERGHHFLRHQRTLCNTTDIRSDKSNGKVSGDGLCGEHLEGGPKVLSVLMSPLERQGGVGTHIHRMGNTHWRHEINDVIQLKSFIVNSSKYNGYK